MEIITILTVVSCFSSPILFVGLLYMFYLYFVRRSAAAIEKQRLEEKLKLVSRTALNSVRQTWFEEIENAVYYSELEVETKFVYPMMRYLGYTPTDLRMRVSVIVRVGRQDISGIADWVVYKQGKPAIVIEAKEPRQWLDQQVQDQARSYCFALNAPAYILANGNEIKVYMRGVDSDLLVFQSTKKELPARWGKLQELVGVPE